MQQFNFSAMTGTELSSLQDECYQKLTMVGYVASEPEFRNHNGKEVINFRFVTVIGAKNRPHAEWYKITVWGDKDRYHQWLRPGARVLLEGSHSTREYQGQAYPNNVSAFVVKLVCAAPDGVGSEISAGHDYDVGPPPNYQSQTSFSDAQATGF